MLKNIMQTVEKNGWKLVAYMPKKEGEYIVICERPGSKYRPKDRNFTVNNYYNSGLFNGQYDLTIEEAKEIFKQRAS